MDNSEAAVWAVRIDPGVFGVPPAKLGLWKFTCMARRPSLQTVDSEVDRRAPTHILELSGSEQSSLANGKEPKTPPPTVLEGVTEDSPRWSGLFCKPQG